MFGIEFEDETGTRKHAIQNSWGLTTRTVRDSLYLGFWSRAASDCDRVGIRQIGVMIMFHSDDKGLVLPPAVAPIQVVFVPIYFANTKNEDLNAPCRQLGAELKAAGVRVEVDERTNYNPGWKFNDWEMRGVPLRIEMGPRDVTAQQVRFCLPSFTARFFARPSSMKFILHFSILSIAGCCCSSRQRCQGYRGVEGDFQGRRVAARYARRYAGAC